MFREPSIGRHYEDPPNVAGAGVRLTVVKQGETSMKVELGASKSTSASATLAAAKKAVRAS